jgi:hypothetical protein
MTREVDEVIDSAFYMWIRYRSEKAKQPMSEQEVAAAEDFSDYLKAYMWGWQIGLEQTRSK